jgi:Mg/Co/Ni transporter MgtE
MPGLNPLELAYAREYPAEVAALLAAQGDGEIVRVLEELPRQESAAVVARLPNGHAARILADREDATVAGWLDAASEDHALALLLHLDEARRTRVLNLLPKPRMRHALERLLNYPETSVGALVDPGAVKLDADMLLADAVAVLRADVPGPEQPIWLVDGQSRYVGRLDPGRILTATSDKFTLSELLITIRPLRAETSLANALDFPEWQKYLELPVVDRHDHLLGTLSRARLAAAVGGGNTADQGLADGVGELTRQYFRVISICLGDLLGLQGRNR